jgi:subtilase family serine protease
LTLPSQAQLRQTLRRHVQLAISSGQVQSLGVLPPAQHLNISLVLPLRNHAQLTGLLKRLYDSGSPDYHQFLNVAEFTEQFGPSPEDYAAVVDFARMNGFTVTDAPANRMIVPVYGTVAQVEKAFHITMRTYWHPTENRVFFSPDREPSLDLSVPVAHIAGLNNFSIPRSLAINARLKKESTTTAVSGSGPGGSYLGSDMRAAYYGGTALTGTGEAVGLVEFDGYDLSDVNLTFSNAGQSYSVPINNVLLDGATGSSCQFQNQCSDAEQVLDIAAGDRHGPTTESSSRIHRQCGCRHTKLDGFGKHRPTT